MDDVEHEWLRLVSVIIFLVPVLFKLNSESKQLRLYSFIIAQILIIFPTFFTSNIYYSSFIQYHEDHLAQLHIHFRPVIKER